MGDILPGTTFSSGQLINADILNRLIGDAEIVSGSIKSNMLSNDLISSLAEISDSEGEDYILIWDASENVLKKIKKTDLAGNAPNVSSADGTLNLGNASGSTALDMRGTTASLLINSDNFAVQSTGAMFLPGDVINLYDNELAFSYQTGSTTFLMYPLTPSTDPKYSFFGQQLSVIGHKASERGTLILSGRDIDADDGTAQYNNWYMISEANTPQLNIYPDPDMIDRPHVNDNLSEPRINIRGNLYISDFDNPTKTLPVVADNDKPKLFVDDIYNTDGTALVQNGSLVDATAQATAQTITNLTNRITALENAGTPSGVITHLNNEVTINNNQSGNKIYRVSQAGVPTTATSVLVSIKHNGNAVPSLSFSYYTQSGTNAFQVANSHNYVINSSDKSQSLTDNLWIPVISGNIYYSISGNNTFSVRMHAYI